MSSRGGCHSLTCVYIVISTRSIKGLVFLARKIARRAAASGPPGLESLFRKWEF